LVSFLYRIDVGFPGTPNRMHAYDAEAQHIMAGSAPTFYGGGVVMDVTGKIRPPVAGDPPAPGGFVYGMYVRTYPTHGPVGVSDPLGTDTPPTSGIASVMTRGYMTVLLRGATPAVKGAPAYIWKAAAAGGQVPGGVTADGSTPANVMAIRNGYFTGPADAKGITEIAFNI